MEDLEKSSTSCDDFLLKDKLSFHSTTTSPTHTSTPTISTTNSSTMPSISATTTNNNNTIPSITSTNTNVITTNTIATGNTTTSNNSNNTNDMHPTLVSFPLDSPTSAHHHIGSHHTAFTKSSLLPTIPISTNTSSNISTGGGSHTKNTTVGMHTMKSFNTYTVPSIGGIGIGNTGTSGTSGGHILYSTAHSQWSAQELHTLHKSLTKYSAEEHDNITRYIKIASTLPSKTIRDVAYKVKMIAMGDEKLYLQKREHQTVSARMKRIKTTTTTSSSSSHHYHNNNNTKHHASTSYGAAQQQPAIQQQYAPHSAISASNQHHVIAPPNMVHIPHSRFTDPLHSDPLENTMSKKDPSLAIEDNMRKLLQQNSHILSQMRTNLSMGELRSNLTLMAQFKDQCDTLFKVLDTVCSAIPTMKIQIDDSLVPLHLRRSNTLNH